MGRYIVVDSLDEVRYAECNPSERGRDHRGWRGTPGNPAAAAAAINKNNSAGRMARRPRSLLSPSVNTKSHEMMRPAVANRRRP